MRTPTAAEIEAIVAGLPEEDRLILPALQAIQRGCGFVPDESLGIVARELNVSRAEVVGVLTYYHDLRTSPPPEVEIRLCGAEACQAVGARELREWADAEYEGSAGTEIATVYCLGNCALGPAAQVNGRLVGLLDAQRLAAAVGSAKLDVGRP